MTAEDFQRLTNVSRETLDKLRIYEELIKKWNPRINLVAKSTLDDLWQRHFLDSAAVFAAAKEHPGRWVDLGSGGGFPGLVLALMADDSLPETRVTCIETDIRKCEFLRTVGRQTKTALNVYSRRIEDTPPQGAKVITARALSSLTTLLGYVHRHLASDGIALLHKGQDWKSEVDQAKTTWNFDLETIPSMTHPDAVILKIRDLHLG